jgi:cbb3-type cytochrome oxidase cytochrome c subunit
MSKNTKVVTKYAESIKRTYGVTSLEIDDQHDHPIMICTMETGIVIKCMGLPNTSGTEPKHVAQNALKRVREGLKLGKSIVAYGGGKA